MSRRREREDDGTIAPPRRGARGRRSLLAWVAALALVACGRGKETRSAASEGAVATVATRFAWGRPSAVRVTHTSDKKGHQVVTRYVVVLDLDDEGVYTRVRYRDVEFVSIDGVKVTGTRELVIPALALFAMRPELRIDDTGALVEIAPVDPDMILALVIASKRAPNPERERIVRDFFAREEGQEILRQDATNEWDSWVGAWLGEVPTPGREVVRDDEVEWFGSRVRRRIWTWNEGEAGPPGHVRLRRRVAAPVAGQQLVHFMDVLVPGRDRSRDAALADQKMTMVRDYDAVIELATLRPDRVVVNDGYEQGGELHLNERSEYRFEWSYDAAEALHAGRTCAPGESKGIPKDQIRAVVRAHLDLTRGCYENVGLAKDPKMQGRLVLRFLIGTDGRVQGSEIAESSLPAAVGECVRLTTHAWRFDPPPCAPVEVSYPFVFETAADAE